MGDSPMAREQRLQRQQQFMKWRMGGKEAPVSDPEFEAIERREDQMKWQKSGWRPWVNADEASLQDKAEWQNTGWKDYGKKQDKMDPQAMMQRQMMMQQAAMGNPMAAMQLMMNPMGQGAKKEEPEMEDPGPPSSNMESPNYRPENMEHIPGLTDRRYCGAMKDWFDDKQFGFVECGELKQKFPTTDVFLHENQRKNYVKGD